MREVRTYQTRLMRMVQSRKAVRSRSTRGDQRMIIREETLDVAAARDTCHILLCTLISKLSIMVRLLKAPILPNFKLDEVEVGLARFMPLQKHKKRIEWIT